MLFDWLVTGQVVPVNPAASVHGPKCVIKHGKTPVLRADQARQLLDSIDTGSIVGLRDRALIGVMVCTFARVSAVVGMRIEDSYQSGKRHEVPAHLNAEAYLDAYNLENGDTLENAQAIADHESPCAMKLYDRTADEITLDEVERILI